ncbi:unnamed protein product [Linum trigynum]|uniref:Uncharacterized protein n=1 Tax=Linum trigynum TaxID=586398 RepID=A0AAV2F6U4_9ROSI
MSSLRGGGGTLERLFFRCQVAVGLWEGAELVRLRDCFPLSNVAIFWRRLLEWQDLDQGALMSVVALFLCVWKAQNWVVLEFTRYIVPVLLSQFHLHVAEWEALPNNESFCHYSGGSVARVERTLR